MVTDRIIINDIEYGLADMTPYIKLNTGKKLKCTYNDGGESSRSTARRQLEKLIGSDYKSIDTLKWYIVDKKQIVKKIENKLNITLENATILALQCKLNNI